jgi:hypothetical protein
VRHSDCSDGKICSVGRCVVPPDVGPTDATHERGRCTLEGGCEAGLFDVRRETAGDARGERSGGDGRLDGLSSDARCDACVPELGVDSKPADAKVPDSKTPDAKVPDSKTPDAKPAVH